MSHVLLDGDSVPVESIDPGLHRFLGTFRRPQPPVSRGANIMCPCGHILQCVEESFGHWQRGHFDVPQYISIGIDE
jgi:hypothetical protein